jgi:hypothetical protein
MVLHSGTRRLRRLSRYFIVIMEFGLVERPQYYDFNTEPLLMIRIDY